MTDALIKTDGTTAGLSAGVAITDADVIEVQQTTVAPASTVFEPFSAVKTWIKSWSGVPGPGYTSGRRYVFMGQNGYSVTGTPLTAGRIYLRPVYISTPTTIASISGNLKTGVGSSNLQFAIYAQDPLVLHRPGALLGSTGSAASTTSNTNIEAALSANAALDPGWYFIGVNSDTNGLAFSAPSTPTWDLNMYMGADSLAGLFSAATNSHIVSVYTASTFGTWPSSLNGATFVESSPGQSHAPVFGFLTA